ncbi:MAG: tRNA (N6-isopentenyl adenosine(37)-C2)-methylthiotransferase MiaB, partial [Erysipelotrichaceae bacterium]|nr:tRNA (N6-isopentenyl adenosine(37)-C2)-methylthiotransferase MiaB [Erysipelotrichaceae bacterium]
MGTHNIHKLPLYLEQIMKERKQEIEVFSIEGDIIEGLPVKRDSKYKAWVNIMYGCDKFCTYCIVPYTRGKQRSRMPEDIILEVTNLVKDGYQEVTLLGQNVNAYGKDLGYENGFAELLEAAALTGIPRIRFVTSHPWDFTQQMIDTIAKYPNIMPYIHLPVQAGNNEVLKRMGRRYTIEEYKDLFNRIKKAIPECAFTTDIIVGFPNETDEQFEDTLKIVDECQYDGAFTFIYSPRAGTPAAKMEDITPFEVKEKRLQRLIEKVGFYANQSNQKYVGKIVKVLVDGPSKKNPNIFSGYTETQKLVNFTCKDVQVGDIIDVEILEAKSWTLNGRQV